MSRIENASIALNHNLTVILENRQTEEQERVAKKVQAKINE